MSQPTATIPGDLAPFRSHWLGPPAWPGGIWGGAFDRTFPVLSEVQALNWFKFTPFPVARGWVGKQEQAEGCQEIVGNIIN